MRMPIIAFWEVEMAKKRGFYSIFVVGSDNFIKFSFLAFLEAKMTKIDIPNPKQIVTNDYKPLPFLV